MSERSKKNCLLVIKNKKIDCTERINSLVGEVSSGGHYFDKISLVPYDSSSEIVFALKDGLENYESLTLIFPKSMEKTLKDYVTNSLGGEFDELNTLKTPTNCVFMLFSDGENRLTANDILNALNARYGEKYEKSYVKTVGAPSAKINGVLTKAKEICPELEFNVSEKFGDCAVEIVYGLNTPKQQYDRALREIVTELNDYIYALENVSLAERLIQLLKLRRIKLGVAESFTGGGIGKKIVEVSGASEVFFESLNTYDNLSKMLRLGVKEQTLSKFGAVSAQTAKEMAEGILKTGCCNLSISTTGIAGPKSDNTKKPVGLLYIGIGLDGDVQVYEYNLKGSRRDITETAINFALFLAFKTVK